MNLRTTVTCLLLLPWLLLAGAAGTPTSVQDDPEDVSLEIERLREENLALKEEVMRLELALFRKGADEPAEATIPRIENWYQHRHLDQPMRFMQELFNEYPATHGKGFLIANWVFIIDAILYIEFREILDRLQPEERPALVREQIAWLKQRETESDEAAEQYAGGVTGPAIFGGICMIDMSRERIDELRRRFPR